MKWSFSYNSFVKLSLYNLIHLITQFIPMDPKYNIIKGLHCFLVAQSRDSVNPAIAGFLAHFYDQYWVMIPMADSMFLPNYKEKIPNSRNKKKVSPLCDILTSLCYNKLYLGIPTLGSRVMFPKWGEKTLYCVEHLMRVFLIS